jgi:hypothetical protein
MELDAGRNLSQVSPTGEWKGGIMVGRRTEWRGPEFLRGVLGRPRNHACSAGSRTGPARAIDFVKIVMMEVKTCAKIGTGWPR